ncbi:small ribosomal subunit protein mS29-like isoform X1 [Crassostrea virginica]|uniref:Small ribosomal subunit protein mS29 n=1 Tax=Crassostrea virginica TaxID=6565 RepID=A0A8B8DPV6_CRAVI|nr:28S ribosomal protein S29, mitochondrial-like isoform X2 [Crassostrea virginica]
MISVGRITSARILGFGIHSALSRSSSSSKCWHRCLTTFRTERSNPADHTFEDEGLFYTIPHKDVQKLFLLNWLGPHERNMNNMFQEFSILIRRPALEVIDILKRLNYNYPLTRFLLYGEMSAGKKFIMTHILHFCKSQNWVLLTVPWANDWNCKRLDVSFNNHRESFFDLPVHSKNILEDFLIKNLHIIKDFTTAESYKFSEQEAFDQGVPLKDLISFGINRMKFANDVVGAVINELQILANSDKIKLLITVRGINSFWRKTGQRKEKVREIHAQQLTLVNQFMDLLQSDTKNAVALCSVESWVNDVKDRKAYLPTELLGKEGIDFLEPFIPIEVPKYSDAEVMKVMDYYEDRKWIQYPEAKTSDGRNQIKFLSGHNPYRLFRVCVPL